MKTGQLKDYGPQARRDFIAAVTDRAAFYGLTADKITEVQETGDVAIIAGRPFPRSVAAKRKKLEEQMRQHGFEQVVEQVAYTWFNRLVAIRFMELHGYLDHGYRVLSHPEGKPLPEIVEHAEHVQLPGVAQAKVIELKLDGNKEGELYRLLLVAQCNALSRAMPFLFESIDDETELLLPDNLLHSDSLIRKLVQSIEEENWQEVEIIGWLYQFYISEKKAEVIGKVVKSEDIPAATQLFTPNWIVKYMVQNTLGRQWIATYPNSSLKARMEYYIEPAEQTPEVQAKLKEITPTSLNPEELTLLDPACGSGHILVEAYDLLKAIYQERGYRAKDIPRLILEKNLFGLEIDDRAAQLAAFALMMKARADDRTILSPRPSAGEGPGLMAAASVQPHVIAIQESKGLDAKEITDALNAPILRDTVPPSGHLFEEIADEKSPLFSRKNLSIKGEISQSDVAQLLQVFEHGKTFGSLIRIPTTLTEKLPSIAQRIEEVARQGGMLERISATCIGPFVSSALAMVGRFTCVVTNPPYMGGKYFVGRLKLFVAEHYPEAKPDLYSCFIQRNVDLASPNGFVAMITIPNWMFLSSFDDARKSLFARQTIDTLVHNGRGVFGSDFGTCSFVLRNMPLPAFRGVFRRLFEKQGSVATNEELAARFSTYPTFVAGSDDFRVLPGLSVAYWISPRIRTIFQHSIPLGDIAEPKVGIQTGDNERFLRLWHEVDWKKVKLDASSRHEAKTSGCKWFPYNKGGPYRRWFGNNDYLVNWENDGSEIDSFRPRSVLRNPSYYFRSSITWTMTSSVFFGVRHSERGFLFDIKGSSCFVDSNRHQLILGFMACKITKHIIDMLNPSTENQVGNIAQLPVIDTVCSQEVFTKQVTQVVDCCITIAKEDWNLHETSWGFEHLPMVKHRHVALRAAHEAVGVECDCRLKEMKRLEEENNSLFIHAYGLQDELSFEVGEDQVTLYRPDTEEDCKRLISYAIGCIMGRYSLDTPGLIYAYNGNKGFDPGEYTTFPADLDGIVPLTDFEWFDDDTAKRFEEFIVTTWPKEHQEDNVKFVADSLGPKSGESPRDTIRRYLATGFYKHHLSMYKRRPIYWLFSSGKQRAFQALVYLHRYNEGTLSRMRTEYVVPLLGKISARIGHLDGDITGATGKHRRDLEKEQATLKKQLSELQEFDDKLRHYADQRIALDLDDGVKVNYAKFNDPKVGPLLAEVKAVNGGSDEE